MANESTQTGAGTQQDVLITRTFDAPRELVWKAWTDPERIMRWWGPETFTSPTCQIDFRVGGKYVFCMRSPEGQDFYSTGVFREIVPQQRLVLTDNFADAQGNIVLPTAYGMPEDFPNNLLITVLFEDAGPGKTKLTLRQSGLPAGEMLEQTQAGWMGSFDKLAESLKA